MTHYKRYVRVNERYITSFEIIKLGDSYISLIEENSFNNRQQLELGREGEIIKLNIIDNILICFGIELSHSSSYFPS